MKAIAPWGRPRQMEAMLFIIPHQQRVSPPMEAQFHSKILVHTLITSIIPPTIPVALQ